MNSRKLVGLAITVTTFAAVIICGVVAFEFAANNLLSHGQTEKAQKLYQYISWLPYGQSSRDANIGETYYQNKDYGRSIEYLEKTRQYKANTSDRCQIYVKLGNAHYYSAPSDKNEAREQQLLKAVNNYDLCLQNETENHEAKHNKVLVQKELDEMKKDRDNKPNVVKKPIEDNYQQQPGSSNFQPDNEAWW